MWVSRVRVRFMETSFRQHLQEGRESAIQREQLLRQRPSKCCPEARAVLEYSRRPVWLEQKAAGMRDVVRA